WWCKQCFGSLNVCAECLHKGHLRHPFHCVQRWTGGHFTDAWLHDVDVIIHLRHGGQP
ncbi:hypothetical protein OF83DRAFT_1030889, partial [Amylostereum chailletii]